MFRTIDLPLLNCSRKSVCLLKRHLGNHKVKLSTKHKTHYKPVIGLEIHAQIATNSKLFSGASTKYGGRTNSQVAFLDAALPGSLPVLNKACVESGVITALALNCQLNLVSYFDRKHYFYADLPVGYQITQQRKPLAQNGRLSYVVNNEMKSVAIWQLQLEQDSGKSLHDSGLGTSLIDLNRAGVGLMEIVTAPDFESAEDAAAFVKELQLLLHLLGTCQAKMEEGSLRVDASVSLHRPQEPLGVRTETKNLNSVRFVKKAIEHEIIRQQELLDQGIPIENETRSFDPSTGTTVLMRDKEKLHDYRFLPEPNLLSLRLHDSQNPGPAGSVSVDQVQEAMPMLPDKRRQMLIGCGVDVGTAARFVNHVELWDLFIDLCETPGRDSKIVCSTLLDELFSSLREADLTIENSLITQKQLDVIINLRQTSMITSTTAKKIIAECLTSQGVDVTRVMEEQGWTQITDTQQIDAIFSHVMDEHPHLVKKYRTKQKSRHFTGIIKLVLEKCEGRIETSTIMKMINDKLLSGRKT